jgi:hypothetical protein
MTAIIDTLTIFVAGPDREPMIPGQCIDSGDSGCAVLANDRGYIMNDPPLCDHGFAQLKNISVCFSRRIWLLPHHRCQLPLSPYTHPGRFVDQQPVVREVDRIARGNGRHQSR